jgi:disulfide bond formation protein DsbB
VKRWIADLATTNFRIVVSIGLAVLIVIVLLIGLMFQIALQSEIVWALVAFVGGMLGIDVTQFSIKRKTEIVTPPQTTAEHATATTIAAAPAPQPPAQPTVASVAEIANQLAAETQAKAARQAGTSFEGG